MDEALRAEAFGLLFVVAQHVGNRADEALAPLGLTARQWLLLAVVARGFPTPPTLTQAAARYGSSRQNVKQIALQLEARGLLELRPDPGDARASRLHLTPRVAEVFDTEAARATQAAFLRDLFAPFPPDDLSTLTALLRRWEAALRPA